MIWANVTKFEQNFIAPPKFFGLVRLCLEASKILFGFLVGFFGLIFWKKLRNDRQILSEDLFFCRSHHDFVTKIDKSLTDFK